MSDKSKDWNEEELIEESLRALHARKAQDVTVIDLRGLSTLADWFVVGTCQSEVQMRSILAGVRRELRNFGVHALRTEAGPAQRWGVLDYGPVIVHVFLREAREYYALERLWKDAPQRLTRAEDYPSDTIVSEDEPTNARFEASEEEW